MFYILVIDDEPKILSGIVTMLENFLEKSEVTVIGYKSVENLLKYQGKIDILITDICMPDVDGIKLGKIIRKRYSDTKIILISGSESFSFAQEAIKIQAAAYLIKPINRNEMKEMVLSIVNVLKVQKSRSSDNIRKEELYRIVTYQCKESEVLKAFFGKIESYAICLFESGDEKGRRQELFLLQKHIARQLCIYSVDCDLVELSATRVMAVMYDGWDKYGYIIEKIISEALAKGEKIKVGVSGRFYTSKDILTAYRHSYIALKGELYYQEKNIFFYESSASSFYLELDRLLVSIFTNLKGGDIERTLNVIDEIYHTCKENRVSIYELQNIFSSVAGTIQNYIEKEIRMENDSIKEELVHLKHIEMFKSWESYRDSITQIFQDIIKCKEQLNEIKEKQYIQKALQYIAGHFQFDISLDEVAAYVNLNSSYFSHYFKKQVGVNFVEYVTRIRLQEAQLLLSEPDIKIKEIASKVGFRDARYFAKIFKNYMGVTPSQYHEVIKEIENIKL